MVNLSACDEFEITTLNQMYLEKELTLWAEVFLGLMLEQCTV